MAKLGALIALLAIFASIIGTAVIFILGSTHTSSVQEMSQEEIYDLLEDFPEDINPQE